MRGSRSGVTGASPLSLVCVLGVSLSSSLSPSHPSPGPCPCPCPSPCHRPQRLLEGGVPQPRVSMGLSSFKKGTIRPASEGAASAGNDQSLLVPINPVPVMIPARGTLTSKSSVFWPNQEGAIHSRELNYQHLPPPSSLEPLWVGTNLMVWTKSQSRTQEICISTLPLPPKYFQSVSASILCI